MTKTSARNKNKNSKMSNKKKSSTHKLLWWSRLSGRLRALIVIVAIGIVGTVILEISHAAVAPRIGVAEDSTGQGYWVAAADGGVFTQGDAPFYGSMGSTPLNAPVVGIAATPDAKGYWLVAADGGVFAFGDAHYFGGMAGKALNKPVSGMAVTPDGQGYWLVAQDGGIFTFGDAGFYGSMSGKAMNAPVVGMASSLDGKGYWLVGSDGGIFTFGDAPYLGSMGGKTLNAPVVGMTRENGTNNYYLTAGDGGVFTFGSTFYGSMAGTKLNLPVSGISDTPDGGGYVLVAQDGGIFTFGDAVFKGAAPVYTAPTSPTTTTTTSTSASSTYGDGCGGNATHFSSTGTHITDPNNTTGYCHCNNGVNVNPYDGPMSNAVTNSKCSVAVSNTGEGGGTGGGTSTAITPSSPAASTTATVTLNSLICVTQTCKSAITQLTTPGNPCYTYSPALADSKLSNPTCNALLYEISSNIGTTIHIICSAQYTSVTACMQAFQAAFNYIAATSGNQINSAGGIAGSSTLGSSGSTGLYTTNDLATAMEIANYVAATKGDQINW